LRTLLLAGAAAAAICLPASAQSVDWSGSYIGIHGGAVMSAPGTQGTDLLFDPDLDQGGFLGGIYLGHDWQDGDLVYGLSADFDFLAITNANAFYFDEDGPFGKGDNYNYDADWLASGRARMGTPFSDRLLVYGSVGVAATRVKASLSSLRTDIGFVDGSEIPFPVVNSSFDAVSKTLFGSVIGLGAEYSLTPNWSMKAEYSHYLFRSFDLDSVGGTATIKPQFGTVKFGVAYRF
jgi:outer membrane immunogenic protein